VIAFGPDVCGDFAQATAREWLETNGVGGYASSTAAGANTRRYHGLLVAALRPPTHRTVLLSKLEETVALAEEEYDLSCNQYPGVIHPQGHRHLTEFRLDPFPTWVYAVGGAAGAKIEKIVAMCRGRNAVLIRYRLVEAPGTVGLIVRPMVNCRDYHHLMRENAQFDTTPSLSGARDVVRMQPYPGAPPLSLSFPGAYFERWGDWYRSFEYPREAERGLDFREDLYSPGFFSRELDPGQTCWLVAAVEPTAQMDPGAELDAERARRAALVPGEVTEGLGTLAAAADAFLVSHRPDAAREAHAEDPPDGIVAGYHWFEEWGRDAMISLPGLTLATGRHDVARAVLRAFASHCDQGLIPNRIPDVGGRPEYNTADATLLMFWAVHKYLEYTEDRGLVEELASTLREVVEWHVRGTRHGIGVADDGLLRAGEPGTQLTWMDAKVGDWVVTPRHGKPVEVNALWHHALRFLEELHIPHAGPPAGAVAEEFARRFWNTQTGHLNDVVDGDAPEDGSLRPNQIFAVSLPYPMLDEARARAVVDAVRRDLLTPYGLRTLSPHDPRYRGRYQGDQRQRDGAYHQGTVWAWLLGPFITAYCRTAADRAAARREARGWLDPFWRHLSEAGLGTVSEIFDGDPPHQARGCVAQAWSVAEILRAAREDLELW
jgi:predicted glycogen debranching enzyme